MLRKYVAQYLCSPTDVAIVLGVYDISMNP